MWVIGPIGRRSALLRGSKQNVGCDSPHHHNHEKLEHGNKRLSKWLFGHKFPGVGKKVRDNNHRNYCCGTL